MSGSSILGRETRYSVLRKSHPPRDSRDCTAGASRTIELSFTFTSEPAFYFPKQPISVVSCCNVSFFANDSSSSNTHTHCLTVSCFFYRRMSTIPTTSVVIEMITEQLSTCHCLFHTPRKERHTPAVVVTTSSTTQQ